MALALLRGFFSGFSGFSPVFLYLSRGLCCRIDFDWLKKNNESDQAPGCSKAGLIAIQRISVDKTNHAIHWIVIYPVDSVIHFSNNRGQKYNNKNLIESDDFQLGMRSPTRSGIF